MPQDHRTIIFLVPNGSYQPYGTDMEELTRSPAFLLRFPRRRIASYVGLAWLVFLLALVDFQVLRWLLVLLTVGLLLAAVVPQRWQPAGVAGTTPSASALINNWRLARLNVPAQLAEKADTARAFVAQGKIEQAESEFHELAQATAELLTKSHPAYIDAITARANMLLRLGHGWSSRCLLQHACDLVAGEDLIHSNIHGPDTQAALHDLLLELADILKRFWELEETIKCYATIFSITNSLQMQDIPPAQSLDWPRFYLAEMYVNIGNNRGCLEIVNAHRPDIPHMRILFSLLRIAALADDNDRKVTLSLVDSVLQDFSDLGLVKDNPVRLNTISCIMSLLIRIGYGRKYQWLVTEYEQVFGWPFRENFDPEAHMRRKFTGDEALNIVLLKIQNREFGDALKFIERLIQILRHKPEKHLLWPCRAVAGVILCQQLKYMEAEEYVSGSLRFHAAYFGIEAPEYIYILLLWGHTLMAKGQQERAESCLRKAWAGFQSRSKRIRTLHTMLAMRELALCLMCGTKFAAAKSLLLEVDRKFDGEDARPAKYLTSRCLGVLEVRSRSWKSAATYFSAGIESHDCVSDPGTSGNPVPAGAIFGEWSLSWVEFEQGNSATALRSLRAAHRHLRHTYGDDNKLAIASSHDLLLMEMPTSVVDDLHQLIDRSNNILGNQHQLTQKIRQSLNYVTKLEDEGEALDLRDLPQRVYTIGNASDRNPQLSEIDWIGWEWIETDPAKPKIHLALPPPTVGGASPMLSPADHGQLDSSPWWESGEVDDPDIPKLSFTPRRQMPAETFYGLADTYVGVLLDIPRDFAPAFIERQYTTLADVPLREGRELGKGGRSERVVEVRNKSTDEAFACKIIRYKVSTKEVDARAQIRAEVNNMRRLSHYHIVKLCASYVVPSEAIYALLMQPVADHNLTRYLWDPENKIDHEERRHKLIQWLPCLLDALSYIHKREMRHMDLKPDNILVKDGLVCIADFGFARDWSNLSTSKSIGREVGGTPVYFSPEHSRERSSASDVFALGCIFAEMITVAELCQSMKAFETHKLEDCGEDEYRNCVEMSVFHDWFAKSRIYSELVKGMLVVDPTDRPHAKDLLARLAEGDVPSVGTLECNHRPAETDKA